MKMKRQKAKPYLWDYDYNQLKKTEKGRIKILERMLNYGPGKEKIKMSLVRKYWDKLNLSPQAKRLLEILIWKKSQSSPKSKRLFWPV